MTNEHDFVVAGDAKNDKRIQMFLDSPFQLSKWLHTTFKKKKFKQFSVQFSMNEYDIFKEEDRNVDIQIYYQFR